MIISSETDVQNHSHNANKEKSTQITNNNQQSIATKEWVTKVFVQEDQSTGHKNYLNEKQQEV